MPITEKFKELKNSDENVLSRGIINLDGYSFINSNEIVQLKDWLDSNKIKCTELSLKQCNIGPIPVHRKYEGAADGDSRALLYTQPDTNEMLKALDSLLRKCNTWLKIDLSHNNLNMESDEALSLLATILDTQIDLRYLNLSGNVFGNRSAEILSQALKSNSKVKLKYLYLHDCLPISSPTLLLENFQQALKDNTTLRKLDIGCSYGRVSTRDSNKLLNMLRTVLRKDNKTLVKVKAEVEMEEVDIYLSRNRSRQANLHDRLLSTDKLLTIAYEAIKQGHLPWLKVLIGIPKIKKMSENSPECLDFLIESCQITFRQNMIGSLLSFIFHLLKNPNHYTDLPFINEYEDNKKREIAHIEKKLSRLEQYDPEKKNQREANYYSQLQNITDLKIEFLLKLLNHSKGAKDVQSHLAKVLIETEQQEKAKLESGNPGEEGRLICSRVIDAEVRSTLLARFMANTNVQNFIQEFEFEQKKLVSSLEQLTLLHQNWREHQEIKYDNYKNCLQELSDSIKYLPLSSEMAAEREEIEKKLIETCIDPNYVDDAGNTLLHYALENDASVDFLLDNGADPFIENKSGISVFQQSISAKQPTLAHQCVVDYILDTANDEEIWEDIWSRHKKYLGKDINRLIKIKESLDSYLQLLIKRKNTSKVLQYIFFLNLCMKDRAVDLQNYYTNFGEARRSVQKLSQGNVQDRVESIAEEDSVLIKALGKMIQISLEAKRGGLNRSKLHDNIAHQVREFSDDLEKNHDYYIKRIEEIQKIAEIYSVREKAIENLNTKQLTEQNKKLKRETRKMKQVANRVAELLEIEKGIEKQLEGKDVDFKCLSNQLVSIKQVKEQLIRNLASQKKQVFFSLEEINSCHHHGLQKFGIFCSGDTKIQLNQKEEFKYDTKDQIALFKEHLILLMKEKYPFKITLGQNLTIKLSENPPQLNLAEISQILFDINNEIQNVKSSLYHINGDTLTLDADSSTLAFIYNLLRESGLVAVNNQDRIDELGANGKTLLNS